MSDYRIPKTKEEREEAERATPEEVRKAWAKYLDLEELKRANKAMRVRTGRTGGRD